MCVRVCVCVTHLVRVVEREQECISHDGTGGSGHPVVTLWSVCGHSCLCPPSLSGQAWSQLTGYPACVRVCVHVCVSVGGLCVLSVRLSLSLPLSLSILLSHSLCLSLFSQYVQISITERRGNIFNLLLSIISTAYGPNDFDANVCTNYLQTSLKQPQH